MLGFLSEIIFCPCMSWLTYVPFEVLTDTCFGTLLRVRLWYGYLLLALPTN